MRLGLERMRALLAELGEPQRRFRALHVVGTNGKTSTTLFAAAILAGARTRRRRVHLAARARLPRAGAGRRAPLDEAALAAAVAARRGGGGGGRGASDEPLTQFEVLTAAAFTALAAAGVDVVAVEAGLGGRYDATNVLAAPVVALTNVGLDHVEQLGGTREAIAGEKLAVLAPGAALVAGSVDAEHRAGDPRGWPRHGRLRDPARTRRRRAGCTAAGRPRALPAREPGARARRLRAAARRRVRPRARARRRRRGWCMPGRLQAIGTDPLVLMRRRAQPAWRSGAGGRAHGRRWAAARRSWACSRSSPTRTSTACSRRWRHGSTRRSPPSRRLRGRCRPTRWPPGWPRTAWSRRSSSRPPWRSRGRREMAGPGGAVLVSGSLSLLEELAPMLVQDAEAR